MSSALLPIFFLAVAGLTYASRLHARRRWSRLKVSGGKKALALNILERR